MNKCIFYAAGIFIFLPGCVHAALPELISRVRPNLLQQYVVRRYFSNEDRAVARKMLAELEVRKGWLHDELQRFPLTSCSYTGASRSVHEEFVRKSLAEVQEQIIETKMRVDARKLINLD